MFATSLLMVSLATLLDPQCQELIDANSRTASLIRTVELEYDLAWIETPGTVVDRVTWIREGKSERVMRQSKPDAALSELEPRSTVEFVLKGDKVKSLYDWDRANPPKITPTHQGRVRADIMPRTPFNPAALSPAEQLRLEVDSMPRRTLADLAKASPNVKCHGKVFSGGRELWKISLESPEQTTGNTTKRNFDVFLDPTAGYLIRRIEVHSDILLPTGKHHKDERVHEVVEFKDVGDGVFFPLQVRNGTPAFWGTELKVRKIKLNEPVDASNFEMEWPKFAAVRHHPAVNGVIAFDIWGNGQPLRSFKGSDDLRPFEAELRANPLVAAELGPVFTGKVPAPPTLSTVVKLGFLGGGLLLLVIVLTVHRRLRDQMA